MTRQSLTSLHFSCDHPLVKTCTGCKRPLVHVASRADIHCASWERSRWEDSDGVFRTGRKQAVYYHVPEQDLCHENWWGIWSAEYRLRTSATKGEWGAKSWLWKTYSWVNVSRLWCAPSLWKAICRSTWHWLNRSDSLAVAVTMPRVIYGVGAKSVKSVTRKAGTLDCASTAQM